MHYHLFVSPSKILCMLGFKNLFKNKKDEGGGNLLHFMQIRYGPQAPAKLLIWPCWAWFEWTQIFFSIETEMYLLGIS